MTVIADISVSSDDFVLGQTMRAVPASRIELEQLVPSGDLPLPYFWVEEVNVEETETALGEESAVKAVSKLNSVNGRVLFCIKWTEEVDSFL